MSNKEAIGAPGLGILSRRKLLCILGSVLVPGWAAADCASGSPDEFVIVDGWVLRIDDLHTIAADAD